MSAVNSERLPNISPVYLGTQASTISLPLMYVRKKSRLKQVMLLDQAGISADNTNYLGIELQDQDGVVYASLDTRAAHEGALTALVGKEMTLSSSLADNGEVEIPALSSLKLVITAHATVTTTKAMASLELYPL